MLLYYMVKLEEVQGDNGKKDIIMTIRTTREKSKWMKEHNVRPSLLFDRAIDELMKKVSEEEKNGNNS